MTGPAIEKIFVPTPRIYPSVFASIAGAETAFAMMEADGKYEPTED